MKIDNTCQAALEVLLAEYGLDADNVWNLDETGVSMGRDPKGNEQQKRFQRRGARGDYHALLFS